MNKTEVLAKRQVFVAVDPGGLNQILALARQFKNKGQVEQYFITQDTGFACTQKLTFFGQNTHIFKSNPDVLDAEVKRFLEQSAPDQVFCATSSTATIEHHFFKNCQNLKINCIGLIDHWTNMGARFIRGQTQYLPDQIWVNDDKAFKLCLMDGLPAELLKIVPNAYFEEVKHFKSELSLAQILPEISLTGKKLVLILTNDSREFYGSDQKAREQIGFCETDWLFIVIEGLIRISSTTPHDLKDCFFVIKKHPKEGTQKYTKLLNLASDCSVKIVELESKDIVSGSSLDLIWHSKFVIGDYSAVLIEANQMNKPILKWEGTINSKNGFKELLPVKLIGALSFIDSYSFDKNLINLLLNQSTF